MQKNVIFSQDHDTRRILLSLSAVTSPNTRPQACATHQPNVGLHPFTTRQRQQEVHLRSGKKGARASEFEIAIQWLIDAGLVYRINRVTSPTMPLKFYEDFSAFKLFTLDVGLMGAMVGNPPEDILIGESCFSEYKGAFTELFVLTQIMPQDIPVYYYSANDSRVEIDFIIQKGGRIPPGK